MAVEEADVVVAGGTGMKTSATILVLMGVSGSGKTTIGEAIARLSGATFADGDDYHSATNKAKMAAGHALSDADREPWLESLNGVLKRWFATGINGVLACSALKQAYRATLAGGMPGGAVDFVLLEGSKEMIAARLAARHHEYMNPKLLDSQLQTLEPHPADDPHEFSVVNDRAPDVVAGEILERVRCIRHTG